jgi:hypothetical protein
MSRIFDALQRSGLEQTGVEYPDMMAVATEVFEAPQGQTSANQATAGAPVIDEQAALAEMAEATVPERAPTLQSFLRWRCALPASRSCSSPGHDSPRPKFRFLGSPAVDSRIAGR